MIFSPITAGLYSLMALGRMGVAWLSIAARTIELLAKIMAPEEVPPEGLVQRRHTLDANCAVGEGEKVEEVGRRNSAPDLREARTQNDPGPIQSPPHRPTFSSQSTDATSSSHLRPSAPRSPVEHFHKSPLQSSLNLVTTIANNPKKFRQNSQHARIDFEQELPHRMHTRAIIAGAVAIHVPPRFKRLLRMRNWEPLSHTHAREVSTEHTRIPESDPAFEEYVQYILPPTALLLDKTLRIHPEAAFREATSGLLQLGFGLYQLISSDAQFSVVRDGLASPFLLVLPYLGMAIVNTTINLIDPPYTVVTVLDISPAARALMHHRGSGGYTSPRSTSGYFSPMQPISERSVRLRMLDNRNQDVNNEKEAGLQIDTSVPSERRPALEMVQSPISMTASSSFSPTGNTITQEPDPMFPTTGNGTWKEFIDWLDFAYDKRIDVSPVDRFYRTPWISHSILIGEFIYTAGCGLLIPLVMLAIVGGWTRFHTSSYGVSLIFNLLALFGLPFIQILLYTQHLLVKVSRDLKSRKQYGTSYWETPATSPPAAPEGVKRAATTAWWIEPKLKERNRWWTTIAQSVGLYFPVRRGIIIAYVIFVIGVSASEFVFVGINLRRTLNCQALI